MNELAPLIRPAQLQVKFDSVAKECPSEGFNYPTFRQLNKHARIHLSEPLNLNPSTSYNLFDVANSKGWFVAVKQAPMGSGLIFSTLDDLRSSFSTAKDSTEDLFIPKRMVSTSSRINIVRFACSDSRLLVSQDNGSILVYDTSQLFTEGTNEVHPSTSTHIQAGYIQQIVPNPGTEPGLNDLVAIVSNGKVQLLNLDLEPQGGWVGNDLMSQPIAVSWSPKGKHLAIGLQTGDILTFSLANKSTPHKHIPPTVDGILASLNWLGPGHTFRTSYASQTDSTPQQYIVVLDAKTSTVTYFSPEHPFPCNDRNYQNAYVVSLPKWDIDSTNDESKSLVVVGDACSIDLEVLGNSGNSWYRQSQENPLSLPLDSAMEDTILVAFATDLTDSASSAPVVYAYLNDGSLQGWHLDHSKPYVGIITPNSPSSPTAVALTRIASQGGGKDTDMSAEETISSSPINQSSTAPNAFSQPFSQEISPATMNPGTSAFGQTVFGQKSSAFGQSTFGQPSAFGATAGFNSASPFNQPSQSNAPMSAFGSVKPASGFGAFAGSNNAFGNTSAGSSPFGSNSGAFAGTSNAFGQGNFGSSPQPTTQTTTSTSSNMTREASMSDSTAGFGSLGLGGATPSDPNARNSMFGSFPNTDTSGITQSSGFGSGPLVKPATGFGAFGNTKPSSTFEAPKISSATSAFSSPSQPTSSSGFGQSGFANPAFGKSTFGQPAFGQTTFGKPSLGAPPTTATPISGGFGAFANTPTSFSNAAEQSKPSTASTTSGGFSAFASSGTSTFGAALASTNASESKPTSQGGFSNFASSGPSPFAPTMPANESKPTSGTFSAFGSATPLAFGSPAAKSGSISKETTAVKSPFGGSATTTSSPFAASSAPLKDTAPRTSEPAKTAFGLPTSSSPFATPSRPSAFAREVSDSPEHASPPSSPEPAKSRPVAVTTTPSSAPNAFSGLQSTPSSFKPATGFGAFGSFGGASNNSPFFKKTDEAPPISAFALGGTPKTPTPTSATAAPTFGSSSTLGGSKSVFAPVTPSSTTPSKTPTSGGFGAFSGASSNFTSYVGNKTSFADLLKTGDEETKDPIKKPASPFAPKSDTDSSAFASPKKETPAAPISVFAPIAKRDEGKGEGKKPVSDEPSFGSISASSASSSFVNVSTNEEGEPPSDEDAENSGDDDSFLSDDLHDASREESSEESDRDDLPDGRSPSPEDASHTSLPARSPSPTPQPETPSIKVTSPVDGDDDDDDKDKLDERPSQSAPFARESSSTPPGTPAKGSQSTAIPPPVTPSASSPFDQVRAGRRTPLARRSPLPNTILEEDEDEDGELEEDDEDDDDEEGEILVPIPHIPVSPKSPIEILPVKLDDDSSIKRPKTPPLLTTLGGKKSPTPSTSSLPPALPPAFRSPSPEGSTKADALGLGALGTLATAASSVPSLLNKPADKTPQSVPARPVTSPPNFFGSVPLFPTPTQGSLFGKPFSLPNAPTLPAQADVQGIKPPAAPIVPGQGIFGPSVPFPPAQQPFSLFGASQKQEPMTPTPKSALPGATPPKSSSPFSLNPASPATPPVPSSALPAQSVAVTLEEGMQKECLNIMHMVAYEFSKTQAIWRGALDKRSKWVASMGGSKSKDGLGDREKWGLLDVEQFGRLLLRYEADLVTLQDIAEKHQPMLREIQSNMLKAKTRREEIARFNKAKNDNEFAKMLRTRTLGPEHSETQMHLRKAIRIARDRIQKMEVHLQEDKKKLAQSTSFKPSFKAPSLDTINRTFRNIELTIEQQRNEVARLASRVSQLSIRDKVPPPSVGGHRRQAGEHLRSFTVTPNVAATTAAALNAERSARRLKNALLRVRKEPLLNVKASTAPTAPVDFSDKADEHAGSLGDFERILEMKYEDLPTFKDRASWDIPPDNFSPTGSSTLSAGFRGSNKVKKRDQVAQRNSPGPTSSISPAQFTPAGFEWGPLPNFNLKTSK